MNSRSMSFESPDVERDFPGLYASECLREHKQDLPDEEKQSRKKDGGKRREFKKEKKDKGYRMFEQEDSDEERLVISQESRSPYKMKKHSKPSFKFPKREKVYKIKEKDKDEKKEEKKKDEKDGEKKKEKLKLKKKPKLGSSKAEAVPVAEVKPIFGVPLAVAVERNKCHDGLELPAMVRECIDYIEEFGLNCEGIYRISGVKSKVQALKDNYNRGQPVYLAEHEPNVIASLLKSFLRELPDPVLTTQLMPKFEQASTQKNVKQKIESFQELVRSLPTPNRLLLSWMMVHMTHVISREKANKMSLQNVSIVLSPTMQISHRVLNVLFTYSKILFRDVVIKKYVPPLRPVTSRWSLELPESPTAIEEELKKQESLLNQLHEQLMQVKDEEKEEQLWEVQRVCTQLKRKLKDARKKHMKAEEQQREIEKQKEARLLQLKQQEAAKASAAAAKKIPRQTDKGPAQETREATEKDTATVKEVQTQTDKNQTEVVQETTEKDTAVIETDKKQAPKVSEEKEEDQAVSKKVPAETEKAPAEGTSEATEEVKVEKKPQTVEETTEVEKPAEADAEAEESKVVQAATAADATSNVEEKDLRRDDEKETVIDEKEKPVTQGPEVQKMSTDQDVESDKVVATERSREQEGDSSEEAKDQEETELRLKSEVNKAPVVPEECKTVTTDAVTAENEEAVTESSATETAQIPATQAIAVRASPNEAAKERESPSPVAEPASHKVQPAADTEPKEPASTHEEQQKITKPPMIVKLQSPLQPQKVYHEEPTDAGSDDEGPSSLLPSIEEYKESHTPAKLVGSTSSEPEFDATRELQEAFGQPEDGASQDGHGKYFGEDEISDVEYSLLQQELTKLQLEEEELISLRDEMRKKIEAERSEIERLHQEIADLQAIREDLYEDETSSDSSEESDDEDEIQDILQQLIRENSALEKQSQDLCEKVHVERQACLEVKVQIRMIQQRQQEMASGDGAEKDISLIEF